MGSTLRVVGAAHARWVAGRRVRLLSEALAKRVPPGARLLDIGCGDGQVGAQISRLAPGITVEGVEVKPRPSCGIPCRAFDGRMLPFPSGSFDGCLLVDVLHHVEDLRGLLREAARASGGFLLIKDHISESRADFATLRFMDWAGNAPHGIALPYNYQSRAQWAEHFRECGLRVRNWTESLPLYPFPFSLVFNRRLHFIALLEAVDGSPGPAQSAQPTRRAADPK